MPSHVPILNVSIKAAVLASPYKHLREQQRKVVENIGHSSCTRDGDHLSLLSKTGNTYKESMTTQTAIHISKNCKEVQGIETR